MDFIWNFQSKRISYYRKHKKSYNITARQDLTKVLKLMSDFFKAEKEEQHIKHRFPKNGRTEAHESKDLFIYFFVIKKKNKYIQQYNI